MIIAFLSTVFSAFLSIVLAFANAGAAAETPGTPTWDATAYTASYITRNNIKRLLSFGIVPPPYYEITFDEVLGDALDELTADTGFDIPGIAAGLPDFFYYQRWMAKLFPNFFYDLRDGWLVSGNEILGIIIGMPQKMHFKTEPTDTPNEYRVLLEMTYADGSVAVTDTRSKYNAETGDLGTHRGILDLGFNLNFKEKWAYTAYDPPMNALGYMKLYDDLLLQNTAVNAVTVRLKFPYQGQDWMLQLWKGRYFNTSGGEIGLYNKPTSRLFEFYDAASNERIGMSFEIYVKETGQPLIVRGVENHWWMTGFAMNRQLYLADLLTLKTEIIPADAAMMEGLLFALEREAPGAGLSYKVSDDGTRLFIVW